MSPEQILIIKTINNETLSNDFTTKKQLFLEKLLENCDIDATIGNLYCKRCKNLIHIDWSKNIASCIVHTISCDGVRCKEVNYQIYV